MNLTPEQQALGRRNFLKAMAGAPALAALGAASMMKGPVRGGPVRIGFIGIGAQGRALLTRMDHSFGEVRALADINPDSLTKADEILAKKKQPVARHYVEWKDMLEKEDLEAIITAVPLWMHAEVTAGCLDAGKHVLCEKMMAWDVAGCQKMLDAARRNNRILEIGYQRYYNPVYQSAYEGVVRQGLLGDVYHARLVWHRNGTWRRAGNPPSPDFDASKWGYPTWDHLLNWRLYWRYSKGLFAELASHQVNAANWFLGAAPEATLASGGVLRYKDREVYDHIYANFEYPGGLTATFSSVESNAFEQRYEAFYGTKGTLIITNENEALLFEEGAGANTRPTGIEVSAKSGPALDASETKPAQAGGAAQGVVAPGATIDRASASTLEVSGFCSAIRVGTPLACGPEKAMHSARACIAANDAIAKKTRLMI